MPYVQRDGDGVVNGYFATLQPGRAEEWLGDDDTELDAYVAEQDRIRSVNISVSAFQAQAAMAQAQAAGITDFNLLEKVEQIVAASGDPMVALAWNKATEFHRSSPTIAALAAQVPLTSDQIDRLFQLAQTITV